MKKKSSSVIGFHSETKKNSLSSSNLSVETKKIKKQKLCDMPKTSNIMNENTDTNITLEVSNNQTKKFKKKKKNKKVIGPDSHQLALIGIEYLNQWKNDRNNWKFIKVKQIRLVSNMFDKEKLPDESFSIFLEYVAGGSESLKKLVTAKANEVTEEMEKWQSLSDEEKLTIPKIDEIKYSRARSLLQNID